MRKIADIKKDLSTATENYRNFLKDGKNEEAGKELENVRTLTNELNTAVIEDAAERALAASALSRPEQREINRFSYTKYFREIIEQKLSGFEQEMAEEAKREAGQIGISLKGFGIPSVVLSNKRAAAGQNVTTPADGGYLVQEEGLVYVEALRAKLFLTSVGATFLTGLRGDLPLVKGGQFTAEWLLENGAITSTGKVAFSKHTMKPKRVVMSGAYSNQLFLQSSIDIDNYIINELAKTHAQALNTAAINGSGTGGEPTGILNTAGIGSVVGGENGAKLDWGKIVDLETAIATENADLGNLAYLSNAKVSGFLKKTEKSTNTAKYLLEGKLLNDYNFIKTNLVPSNIAKGSGKGLSALIFGNFADLVIGQWGGLDFIIDPYSLKKSGDIEIVASAFHDIALRNEKSFAAMKDIITAE